MVDNFLKLNCQYDYTTTNIDPVEGFEQYLEKCYSEDLEGIESLERRSRPVGGDDVAVVLEEEIDVNKAKEAMEEAGYDTNLDEYYGSLNVLEVEELGNGKQMKSAYAGFSDGQDEFVFEVWDDHGEMVPSGDSNENKLDALVTYLDHLNFN